MEQNSPESDYNAFLDNLVNKRRQVADSNPKNFTHFSGNAMASSNANASPNKTSPAGSSKSIIIGAGQPIIVPNQQHVHIDSTSVPSDSKQTLLMPDSCQSAKAQPVYAKPTARNELNTKVTSVEEFCPDEGMLDKSFLDELPSVSPQAAALQTRQISCDSDSDGNENFNPLVAQFHEDPTEFIVDIPNVPNESKQSTVGPLWANPLAKQSNADWALHNLSITSLRRNSISSDDTEVPAILNEASDCSDSNIGVTMGEYDRWLSDTNQRRSPEGGEDETTITSTDKDIDAITNAIKNLSDGDSSELNRSAERSAHKKKKKDKKDKSDDKERKKKKRSERKHRSNEASTMEPDLYEAI